ncbi:hypothetical protein BpHYR1_029624 [Brachionus plicatilis]|uniref:Uncharacterized protein n=1 Tax=Brachionus plicatilis TaxID=10195 RepID=A0A3M7RBU3_BRAPC|nr:hypothetical protein BpHYR1_029624 [Brachionus plicatilis]
MSVSIEKNINNNLAFLFNNEKQLEIINSDSLRTLLTCLNKNSKFKKQNKILASKSEFTRSNILSFKEIKNWLSLENLPILVLSCVIGLWFFNTFTFGFVLNFISYLNSNWLRNNVYTYGLFEYCEIALTNHKNQTYPEQTFSCNFWSNSSKPNFIKYSVSVLTVALTIHFLSIIEKIQFFLSCIHFFNT